MSIKQTAKILIGKLYAKRFHYDEKFLTGKWFTKENNYVGWNWVITNSKACKRLNTNLNVKWPVSPRTQVVGAQNIEFSPDDLNNFQHFGCYFQGKGKIIIGKGTYIAPNVGIITANHNINNLDTHQEAQNVILGEKCWVGMNSVILPGVILGDNTVVGAGSVVTKPFPNGHCIIAGNPAKKIRDIDTLNEEQKRELLENDETLVKE